jgi:hypothetical protein
MMAMGEATVWGMIDARPIVFPAPVQEMNAAFLEFSVPTERARSLLPGDAFEVAESPLGTAHVVVAAHEYRRGAWGPANTLEIAVQARPAGKPLDTTGVFLCDAPVSEQFIREAAKRTLGTPKAVEPVGVETTDADVTFSLTHEGEPALTLRMPRVEAAADPVSVGVLAYTYLDDEPYVMPFDIDVPTGSVDPESVVIEVGKGWFADMLRTLGLPRAPDVCTWGEGLTALFHLAAPLAQKGRPSRAAARLSPKRYPRGFYPGRRLAEAAARQP